MIAWPSLFMIVLPTYVVLALSVSAQIPGPQLLWMKFPRMVTPSVCQSLKPPWFPSLNEATQCGFRYCGGTGLCFDHPRALLLNSPSKSQVSL